MNNLSASLLAWLRCFDAVARNDSFTIAAQELHVTQGSVSQQVKKLEDYLGAPLFHREGKRLSFTREGARLATATGQSFLSLNQVIGKLREARREQDVTLNLSCSPSFAMLWLTPRVGDLLRTQHGMAVRIHGEFHTLDRIEMGRGGAHAGIRFDPGNYVDLHSDIFLDEWLIPVATPEYLAQHPEILDFQHLPPSLMIHDEEPWQNAPRNIEWDTWIEANGNPAPNHTGVYFNLSQLAIISALSGQGVAMGRMALVYAALTTGTLLAPFPFAVKSKASYQFIYQRAPSSTTRHLQDWLHHASCKFAAERNSLLERLGVTML